MTERRPRVVIADDDDDIRGLMVIAAERAGVEVAVAVDNGRSALDALLGESIDLALLDISMPALNGIEVAEAVRAEHPETLILMVSASVQLLTDHGVVAERSDSFIVKPFSPRALSDRIRQMLGLEASA